eukprot:359426-Chlamydomonas_euryale.AAC.10
MEPEEAFRQSVESITGNISRTISTEGMLAVYNQLDDAGKKIFEEVRRSVGVRGFDGGVGCKCGWAGQSSMRARSPSLVTQTQGQDGDVPPPFVGDVQLAQARDAMPTWQNPAIALCAR